LTGLPPQSALNDASRASLMRAWRDAMQYTQKELAELCGFSETHISLLECSHTKISDRTLNQLAMMFAIHSLPP